LREEVGERHVLIAFAAGTCGVQLHCTIRSPAGKAPAPRLDPLVIPEPTSAALVLFAATCLTACRIQVLCGGSFRTGRRTNRSL
jgi:hypothetical protein